MRMALLRGMPAAGADLIEIGMPFTDPMADGPIIQAAGKRALAGRRQACATCWPWCATSAPRTTPRRSILMGYLNPILSYGTERFCADAAAAGVDGLIVVDLPTEEADMLLPYATRARHRLHPPGRAHHRRRAPAACARRQFRLRLLRLASPASPARAAATDRASGSRRSRASARRPTCRSPSASACARPQQAATAARIADAAVVASALIDTLAANLDDAGKRQARRGAQGAGPGARAGRGRARREGRINCAGILYQARSATQYIRRIVCPNGLGLRFRCGSHHRHHVLECDCANFSAYRIGGLAYERFWHHTGAIVEGWGASAVIRWLLSLDMMQFVGLTTLVLCWCRRCYFDLSPLDGEERGNKR